MPSLRDRKGKPPRLELPWRNGTKLVRDEISTGSTSTISDSVALRPKKAQRPRFRETLNPRINVHWFRGRSPSKCSIGTGPELVDARLAGSQENMCSPPAAVEVKVKSMLSETPEKDATPQALVLLHPVTRYTEPFSASRPREILAYLYQLSAFWAAYFRKGDIARRSWTDPPSGRARMAPSGAEHRYKNPVLECALRSHNQQTWTKTSRQAGVSDT